MIEEPGTSGCASGGVQNQSRIVRRNLVFGQESGADYSARRLPAYIEEALIDFGLLVAFLSRPPYQQDGYLSSIENAHLPAVRDARVADMLDELAGTEAGHRRRSPTLEATLSHRRAWERWCYKQEVI